MITATPEASTVIDSVKSSWRGSRRSPFPTLEGGLTGGPHQGMHEVERRVALGVVDWLVRAAALLAREAGRRDQTGERVAVVEQLAQALWIA